MPQKPQIVDITKSYLPGDPNSFVQNLVNTDREDGEEKTLPLVPYEGCNILPTHYGYKSYFGTNSSLEVTALGSRAQHVLLYQTATYQSRLIALCEDGIWVASGETSYPDWVQVVTQAYDPDVFEEWTWCLIENTLYMYKQGNGSVYRTTTGDLILTGPAISPVTDYVTMSVAQEAVSGDFNNGYTYRFKACLRSDDGLLYGAKATIGDLTIVSGVSVSVLFTYTGTVPTGLELVLYIEDLTGGSTYVGVISTASPVTISNLTSGGFATLLDVVVGYSMSLSDTSTGDGTFDGSAWDVRIQFLGTDPFEHEISSFGSTTPGTNSDIFINFVPTPNTVRIILNESGSPALFYKDMTATTSITIPNLTGFTSATEATLPGTLTNEPDVTVPDELTVEGFVPSFLNMTGQMGIFRAGLRLGMWDSANSVSWSSNLDLEDFTPSIENLAGNTIFGRVTGRIMHCRGHGEGFVVYSTRSVVGATYSAAGNLLWDAHTILDNTGIAYSRAIATGKTDSEHYAFATTGIYAIGKYNPLAGRYEAEAILPEIYDLLKESRDPVQLTVLQDRYLCFSLIPSDYITGKQSFYTGYADPYDVTVDWYVPQEGAGTGADPILPEQMYEIIRSEFSGKREETTEGQWVPLYNVEWDHIDTGYYSYWMGASLEDITGLLSYSVPDPFIATITDSLTAGELSDNLDAPDSTDRRAGEQKTMVGVRPFFGRFDSDIPNRAYRNVETAVFNQLNEWEWFERHQGVNKIYLELVTDIVESYGSPFNKANRPTNPLPSDTNVTTVIGTVITGGGNNQWLFKKGPAKDAAREMILRRTFNKAYEVTKRTVTEYSYEDYGTGATYAYDDPSITTSVYSSGSIVSGDHTTDTIITKLTNGSGEVINWETSVTYHRTDNDIRPGEYTQTVTNSPYYDPEGTYVAGADARLPATPADGNTYLVSYFITTRDSYWEPGGEPPMFLLTSSLSGPLFYTQERIKTTVTTTYEVEEITGQYGYSELRATVTYWDRIKDNLYGNYEILERVPASAMTPQVWSGVYPDDKGANRTEIVTFSEYSAILDVDQSKGRIGPYEPYRGDPDGSSFSAVTGYETEGLSPPTDTYTLPGTSFLLQVGSVAPSYNDFSGALVYDLQLKKWGKYKGTHKQLLEAVPLNSTQSGAITYSDLGLNAGILDLAGLVYLFDATPAESWLRWGKLGYYRLGMTNLLEVRASTRYLNSFSILTESSLDGKIIDHSLSTAQGFNSNVVAEAYLDVSARWHTVKIAGNFDLTGLEVRATLAGRR